MVVWLRRLQLWAFCHKMATVFHFSSRCHSALGVGIHQGGFPSFQTQPTATPPLGQNGQAQTKTKDTDPRQNSRLPDECILLNLEKVVSFFSTPPLHGTMLCVTPSCDMQLVWCDSGDLQYPCSFHNEHVASLSWAQFSVIHKQRTGH